MRRALRILTTARWLGLHLLVLVLTVAMILLGRWQLDVSNAKHFDLQNFFYAFQWWTFAAFALHLWVRVMRDALTPPAPLPAEGRVAVRDARTSVVVAGPAVLVGADSPDRPPVVYRGYVMPQSASTPDRSTDDRVRAAYNDQLWQLAMADSARGEGPAPTTPREVVDLSAIEDANRALVVRPAGRREPDALPGPVPEPP